MNAPLLDVRPVTVDGVYAAADRLKGKAIRTPLIENAALNEAAGGRILVKAEVLQHYGAFKFRGAYNLISQLNEEERAKGVLAWSSGNHAQGVAYAAKLLGVEATILMPADAPSIKMENVRALGAHVLTYDRYSEDREEIAAAIVKERGLAVAPPFDHPHTIEGQATVALETFEDAVRRGLSLDRFIVCCGGGGLTAGCATVLEDLSPATEVHIAEPEGFDETWSSIRDGVRHRADPKRRTICDAIATPTPGRITLPIMQRLVKGGASLTEDEIKAAMRFAFKTLKLVVEPGGAAALAAVLTRKVDCSGKIAAITLSGGNVDPALFSTILAEDPAS